MTMLPQCGACYRMMDCASVAPAVSEVRQHVSRSLNKKQQRRARVLSSHCVGTYRSPWAPRSPDGGAITLCLVVHQTNETRAEWKECDKSSSGLRTGARGEEGGSEGVPFGRVHLLSSLTVTLHRTPTHTTPSAISDSTSPLAFIKL